ncbi:hypothetical protein VST7929_01854 [Vibrio stylophorae]|uniref:ApeI dehydratase-like domain-containing protein n=1 Tax=Vibrio stylophorae TaxID=659351 RepID=A0ABM8ZUH9_9VIBR|nr:3-hydroxyacyl-ACP dehydratase [Vibrio stylophorae]CAH0533972.1 hypothetical protein VST7929_01854 [Vibrio stylophorae]
MKRKPSILGQEQMDNGVELTLNIDADIADFQGHFEQFALLPGVTQTDWAIQYSRALLPVQGDFLALEALKFQEPMRPNMTVKLALKWDASKRKVSFQYQSEKSVHASGRIAFSSTIPT